MLVPILADCRIPGHTATAEGMVDEGADAIIVHAVVAESDDEELDDVEIIDVGMATMADEA